jgi:hypothetical protein
MEQATLNTAHVQARWISPSDLAQFESIVLFLHKNKGEKGNLGEIGARRASV